VNSQGDKDDQRQNIPKGGSKRFNWGTAQGPKSTSYRRDEDNDTFKLGVLDMTEPAIPGRRRNKDRRLGVQGGFEIEEKANMLGAGPEEARNGLREKKTRLYV